MKNFTCLILIGLISFMAGAENISGIQRKLHDRQNRLKPLLEAGSLMQASCGMNIKQGFKAPSTKSTASSLKLDSIVTRIHQSSGEWKYDWKEEFQYNTDLKNTVWVTKEWNEATQEWYISGRMEMEFDSHGRIHAMLSYSREEPELPLELDSKTEANYDASGRLESVMYYTPGESSDWVLDMKQLFTYNASGKVLETNTWSNEDGELVKSIRMVYTYDSSGKIELTQTYYIMEDEEILYSESHFGYDVSGRLINEENWTLSFMTFTLQKSSLLTTTYNASGDIATETYSSWNAMAQAWNPEDKDEYTYGSINFSEVVFPSYILLFVAMEDPTYYIIKIINEINTYEYVDNAWELSEKTNYYYSSTGNVNVDQVYNESFSLFPNPASESIKIRWSGKYDRLFLQVFGIDGTKVMEQNAYSGKDIPVFQLNRGVYIYRLMNGREILHAGKLIRK